MKKQSSIEWLVEQFDLEMQDSFHLDKINQAKEMHKQEIVEATKYGNSFEQGDLICETYYKKTYETNT